MAASNTNFARFPCTPEQTASNWQKVADTINNIVVELANLDVCTLLQECDISALVCEALSECDLCGVIEACQIVPPKGFPDVGPTTVTNILNQIWNTVEECCGGGANFCTSVQECLPSICDAVRDCVIDTPWHPPWPDTPGCGNEDYCWSCFDVVTEVYAPTDIAKVVYPIDLAPRVVTDVDINTTTCELTVQYYDQTYGVKDIEYVTEVDDEPKLNILALQPCAGMV